MLGAIPKTPGLGVTMLVCPACGGQCTGRGRLLSAQYAAICRECGTWYRVPRPTPSKLINIYGKEYYDCWQPDNDPSAPWKTKTATFLPLLRRVERLLAPGESGSPRFMLDVGAATGTLLQLARQRGWIPFAVEINPYAASILKGLFGQRQVFEGELTDCPFHARTFDAIIMTDVIEHVTAIGETLRAARRLLLPDGVLCLTTPRVDCVSRLLMGRNWLHFKEEHIQYFSARGIDRVLQKSGFVNVTASPHRKYLSLDYIYGQFQKYRHCALTPAVAAVRRLVPAGLRCKPLGLQCGEMLVTARVGNAVGVVSPPAEAKMSIKSNKAI